MLQIYPTSQVPACLDSVRRSMQHVTTQCDVCLSMCDNTVQFSYELYVVLNREAT